MVKWDALARPKDFGGLGFMDVRAMNTCLVGKWIDKLEKGTSNVCCDLLRKKYLGDKSIFQIKRKTGSQFWRGLLETRDWFQWGRAMKVRSGTQTRFWHDIWVGNCALKLQFPKLFSYSSNKDVSVQETHADGVWSLQFRRSLSDEEMGDWSSLLDLLSTVQLVEGQM